MRRWLTLILGLLLLGGCTLPSDMDSPLVGPSSDLSPDTPSPLATPTPSPTPTPLPTPIPTPEPGELLARAERAYAVGDWETAEELYRRLASLPAVSQEEAARTTVGLARALFASDQLSEGIGLLQGFVTAATGPLLPDAHLLLAEAYVEMGEPGRAVAHYAAVAELEPVLASHAHEWRGDALRAGGSYTEALGAYGMGLDLASEYTRRAFLNEKLALTHASLGHYEEAVAAYDVILAVARIPSYRARIAYQAADTALIFGEREEAARRFREVLLAYPEEDYGYEALVRLVELGEPVDDLLRGKVDYHAGAYVPAVEALNRHVLDDPDHTGEAHYYAALSYLEAGSPRLALSEIDLLLETHPGDAYWGSGWIVRARVLRELGYVDEAVSAYRTLPESQPDHPRAASALWEAAEFLEGVGRAAEAVDAYLDLAERYPDDSGAPAARFRAGLLRYMGGDPQGAQAAWEELLLWYPQNDEALAGRFWLGKSHLEAGNVVSATTYLSETRARAPWDHYGIRAADLLAGRAPLTSPPAFSWNCDPEEGQAEVLAWLAGWWGAEGAEGESPDLSVPPAALLADARLERGLALLRVGRFDEGRATLEALREAFVGNPHAQFHLALILRDAGLYRSSIIAAATVWQLSPAYTLPEIPRYLGCLAYPTYFHDLVDGTASEFGLHPLVVYSLLRQESLFEGFATSFAAAHGLMQVIPSTGDYIATNLGWPAGYETSDLYRPMVSVRFGTWYLAQQRDRFDGALYPSLAGYNGGPGNAARWWEAAGEDPDLFVELIAFDETRRYVERITEHHAKYRYLYGQ